MSIESQITERNGGGNTSPSLQFTVSRGEDFISALGIQTKKRPEPSNAEKQLKSRLIAEINEKRHSPERHESERRKEETKKRLRRDGFSNSTREFRGFHASERVAEGNERRILWGKSRHDQHLEFHVLTFDSDGPCQHVTTNKRVVDCWIAESSDCFVMKIWEDEESDTQKCTYLIFDVHGELMRKFRLPQKWVTFLGISETGSHYLWNFKGWLHVTACDSGIDFLNKKLPHAFNPNVAALDSERSAIKLIAHEGMKLEISWEDDADGHFPNLAKKLETAGELARAEIIREEWDSRPDAEKYVAEFLLPWVRTVTRENVGEGNSTFSWKMGWNSFLKLRRKIEVAAGDSEGAAQSVREIDEYLQPFETANSAYATVRDAIKAKDIQKIDELAVALNDAIETKKLEPYPHLQAKCFRYLGEIAHHNTDLIAADKFYSQAVALDPAVGCKRNLEKVKKELTRKSGIK